MGASVFDAMWQALTLARLGLPLLTPQAAPATEVEGRGGKCLAVLEEHMHTWQFSATHGTGRDSWGTPPRPTMQAERILKEKIRDHDPNNDPRIEVRDEVQPTRDSQRARVTFHKMAMPEPCQRLLVYPAAAAAETASPGRPLQDRGGVAPGLRCGRAQAAEGVWRVRQHQALPHRD
jgi:hypothetical protein